MTEHETAFEAMGSELRILLDPQGLDADEAAQAAEEQRRFVGECEASWSRFDPRSELCSLNADPRRTVPVSDLLGTAVSAALEAARTSAGLVDPTLLAEIEDAGYRDSWSGSSATLAEALSVAPPRRPASPRPDPTWARIEIDAAAGAVSRPPGVRIDTGGIGKGLAADLVAARLRRFPRFVVDCGGDIRIGGVAALTDPYEVAVEHPLSGKRVGALRLGWGGIATSGLGVRLWRAADGSFRHHLIDPSTGTPAWTGLIGATALGDSAVGAETAAKAALLGGPEGGRKVLADLGGLLFHDDGRMEKVGPIAVRRLVPEP
ncbi:MAG: FAD:protein FMN transferase [Actinobacteria bacterium]|nr:FAD:protein FMN transferase [Actinomycetota bacterium]